ncbi:golvesin C-terminal-like domain-containing protein [Kutzneria sp. CA-103260]|uniref:golvesin C-terminal-like domain-containing protein n=1 Tax=Kutzneria sp. CA-103260 TaxID=2802641 RepID=UPI001BA96C1F|nr:polymorphic toxin-type HINT domain-containing protein [Kutzneria sp. CA-103260]
MLLAGQSANGAAPLGIAPAHTTPQLGPATNWRAEPGQHHGQLVPSTAALPHRQPAATSKPLAVSKPKATTSATYSAPTTPQRMIPGEQYSIPFALTNSTGNPLPASQFELSYHWTLPDGTDRTDQSNRLGTALPNDLAPGQSATFDAHVVAPTPGIFGNERQAYVLRWDLRDKKTGAWLSQTANVPTLDQNVAVEQPTSDQLGLENFYQYSGVATGAGSSVSVNAANGNLVFGYAPLTNPGRGLSSFVRLSYNSLDTSNSYAGAGWSVSASSLPRLGTPLQFDLLGGLLGYPGKVTLVDGDGTSHVFSLNKHGSNDPKDWDYDKPAGVHLYLQHTGSSDPNRAWVMTQPDRTQFFFDADGFQTATVDRNGNTMTFNYTKTVIGNRNTGVLTSITDPAGRQSLTFDYYKAGEAANYFSGDVKKSTAALPNNLIVNQLKSITDLSGRTITFTYSDTGLLQELADGAGTPQEKDFDFFYDNGALLTNPKLIRVNDPLGHGTQIKYFTDPSDQLRYGRVQTLTDRSGAGTAFDYTATDPKSGTKLKQTITDPLGHASSLLLDGFGRMVSTTDAKNETTNLNWDADNNVIRLQEANNAVSTWVYDQNTGYPLQITDAQNAANGGASIGVSYQTFLNGHVADVVSNTSAEGRTSTFGYDQSGNLISVTDPNGNVSGTPPGHFTTKYTYDSTGQPLTSTDANGHSTRFGNFDPNGFPQTTTDALGAVTTTNYDVVGNVVSITDANHKTSTYTYDIFKRPLLSKVPKDQDKGQYVVTPGPVYDRNDNVVRLTAPNGAVGTASYDASDRVVASTLPKDTDTGPNRLTTYGYDRVGNTITTTQPNGNLPGAARGSFTTTNTYDELNRVIAETDANGGRTTYTYNNVGDNTSITDPLGHVTAKYTYDLNHRTTSVTDADGHTKSTGFDRDGLQTSTTDEEGNKTSYTLDARGMTVQVQAPFRNDNGTITNNTTRYEFDEVGNQTKVISPRAVAAGSTEAFVSQTRYDPVNRVQAQLSPFDPNDSRYNKPSETDYSYDAAGQLTRVSAPPSQGQTVRNDTTYNYFDNGWSRSSTDPVDISTNYDYNDLGQQTVRTLTSAGGSSSRSMSWDYYPDGKVKTRADVGVPAGSAVELVDNSDAQNVSAVGSWPASSAGSSGFQGYDYQTHAAGPGTDSFSWNLVIPQDGTYDVYVRYPSVAGAAKDAAYTVNFTGGTANTTVDQTQQAGDWVKLGSWAFTADGSGQKITLAANAGGVVTADAVKVVRQNNNPPPPQKNLFNYSYDADGNLTDLADQSTGAQFDDYAATFDGMDRLATVKVGKGGAVQHTTTFSYDADGNTLTRGDDAAAASFAYDARNLLTKVTNAESATDPKPKVTTFGYDPSGQVNKESRPNGNVVTSSYFLNGQLQHQIENKSDGTVVAEHTLDYDPDGNKTQDVAKTQNADNHSAYVNQTTNYSYDPLDRLAGATKTGGGQNESYVHDANNNVVSQTIGNQTTTSNYDRNRLQTTSAGGFTTSYNYDVFGRLDTVTLNGNTLERYGYDGFDHIATDRKKTGDTVSTTSYAYDPFDRTVSQTTDGKNGKTTTFDYLGVSGAVTAEHENGKLTKTYQYSPWGERLSQVVHKDDGSEDPTYYSYSPHSDVQAVTDANGDTKATYGYTAYGADDSSQDTGADKSDPAQPDKDPYNAYRFNAARINGNSSTYNMGFRTYDPGLNSFLTRDSYNGALSDLSLTANPFTGNRYAFGGGNPLSNIELNGHNWLSDLGHAALDVAGMIPVVGAVADVANAAWYAVDGDYLDAGLSLAGAIPVIGDAALGTRYAIKGAKYVDEGIEAAEAISTGVKDAEHVAEDVKAVDKTVSEADQQAAKQAQAAAAQKAADEAAARKAAEEAAAKKAAEERAEAAAEQKAEQEAEGQAESQACPVTNSFPAATAVLMGDGTTKAISDVQVGDRVQATDPTTGATRAEPVDAQIVTPGDQQFTNVTVHAATGDGTITSTQQHPFWDATAKKFVNAADLKPGDELREPDGDLVAVVSVVSYLGQRTAFNLTVDDLHTYYVMVNGVAVLVHNSCRTARALGTAGETALGIPPGKVRIPSASGTASYRVPDYLSKNVLLDVKNVSHLDLTDQLADFYDFASATSRTFAIIARQDTTLSPAIRSMQNLGLVRIFRWLPPINL